MVIDISHIVKYIESPHQLHLTGREKVSKCPPDYAFLAGQGSPVLVRGSSWRIRLRQRRRSNNSVWGILEPGRPKSTWCSVRNDLSYLRLRLNRFELYNVTWKFITGSGRIVRMNLFGVLRFSCSFRKALRLGNLGRETSWIGSRLLLSFSVALSKRLVHASKCLLRTFCHCHLFQHSCNKHIVKICKHEKPLESFPCSHK